MLCLCHSFFLSLSFSLSLSLSFSLSLCLSLSFTHTYIHTHTNNTLMPRAHTNAQLTLPSSKGRSREATQQFHEFETYRLCAQYIHFRGFWNQGWIPLDVCTVCSVVLYTFDIFSVASVGPNTHTHTQQLSTEIMISLSANCNSIQSYPSGLKRSQGGVPFNRAKLHI